MPGMWIGGVGRISTIGQVSGSSLGTTITAGTGNAKGNFAQLTASTPHDAHAIIVSGRTNLNGQSALVDIAMGGAGSERIFIEDLLIQGPRAVMSYFLPIYVPGGVRLAARAQSSTNSGTQFVSIMLLQNQFGSMPPLTRARTYGANAADSGGTSVDPGGTGNTKGSYVQITGSTAWEHKGIIIGQNQDKNTGTSQADWLVDVAIGGAGSEQIIIPDLWINQAQTGLAASTPSVTPFIPYTIPAGSRIAIRAQCTISDATDRLCDYVVIGLD